MKIKMTEQAKEGCLMVLIKVLLGLLLWMPLCYWHGYVSVRLWEWFIVPFYPAVPRLTIYVAVGLAFFWQSLGRKPSVKTNESQTDHIVASALWPAVMLCAGWVWHYLQWGI
jgi:hypothetical protein